MTSLVVTITETLRYRGAIGQWSWVLHRVTGLGVLFFLILHVIDTSWSVFYPTLYEHAIKIYQSPLFTIGEFALVAAVVYHALNGIRIAVFDYRPDLWKHQQKAAVYVLLASVLILIPSYIAMFGHVLKHYNSRPDMLPIIDVIISQLPFLVGMVVAAILAMALSFVYGLVVKNDGAAKKSPRDVERKIERFWWSYMRISGVLILPLVLGHLAMMHLLQGVFDITAQNFPVVLTTGINATGLATEFVFHRWSYAIGGIYIWRLYDIALLALVTIHGFNGLRYVFTDYVSHPIVKRGLVILCLIGALVLLAVGGAALIAGVSEKAVEMAKEATFNVAH